MVFDVDPFCTRTTRVALLQTLDACQLAGLCNRAIGETPFQGVSMRRIALVLVLGAVFSCKTSPDDEPVAKVNGQAITRKEFNVEVERQMTRYKGQNSQLPPGIEQRVQESVLRRMIDDMMIAQKAKEISSTVSKEELDAKYKEYKDRFRTEQAFQDYLKRSNNSEENMRADLERNLLRDRVVEKLSGNMDVSDDEVKKYYDENVQRFLDKEQVKASRILIRLQPNTADKDKKALLKKAKDLRGKAAKSDADFAALAKDNSQGPEASRGGDLGWFTRGRMPPEFDNVAFTLQANQVSDVIETKMGFEVIKVHEKKAEHQRTLEEVKENIKNSLLARKRNEKRRDVLRDLKTAAKVEQLITFDKPAAPGVPGAPTAAAGETPAAASPAGSAPQLPNANPMPSAGTADPQAPAAPGAPTAPAPN